MDITDKLPKETVVLLHGIAKSKDDLAPVEEMLLKNGYKTLNFTYPSKKKNLDEIAEFLHTEKLDKEFWEGAGKVNFVTHSMGGLVARRYFDKYRKEIPAEKLGRVVMMGPPNQGSEVADLIHNLWPYKWYYGPAGEELTTKSQSRNKSEIYYELGVIAGTKEWPYFVSAFVIPDKSDGRVAVKKTKIKGMADHITVNATHTFIMKKPDTQKHILTFLKEGHF